MMAQQRQLNMSQTDPDMVFARQRPGLVRLAYRMLGTVADAEDMVQDAWLCWLATDQELVREPAAFLRTIVARLCLNELNSARRRREIYFGPWLPEPIVEPEGAEHEIDDITLPLMVALESLSPLERAAFLLHDVFGAGFDEVAEAIGHEAATCRKLASRARDRLRTARPRFPITKEHGLKIASAFFAASRSSDMEALRSLLAEDIVAYADGGDKVPASPQPLFGLHIVLERHAALARDFTVTPSRLIRNGVTSGLPGFVSVEADKILQTTALQIEEGKDRRHLRHPKSRQVATFDKRRSLRRAREDRLISGAIPSQCILRRQELTMAPFRVQTTEFPVGGIVGSGPPLPKT